MSDQIPASFAWTRRMLCLALFCAGAAQAASHALLILVADYPPFAVQNVPNDLPGVMQDEAMAGRIAGQLGVPAANRVTLLNRDAHQDRVLAELDALSRRAGRDDHVLIYFSGHGYREEGPGGQCVESLVTADSGERMLLAGSVVREKLRTLANRVAQVVVLLDACHSGGIGGTRALERPLPPGILVKAYMPPGGSKGGLDCHVIANAELEPGAFRSLASVRNNLTVVAAARHDEVARASGAGSYATRAWLACLENGRADRNRSGGVDAGELLECAQAEIDRATAKDRAPPQHLALHGNGAAVMSFAATETSPPASRPPAAAGSPADAIADLFGSRDPNWEVSLTTDNSRYRIGQERVRLTARSARDGYLYVFMNGSSNRCATLLFPNRRDQANRIAAQQPLLLDEARGWAVWPGGPAGTDTLTAVVTSRPIDLTPANLLPEGPFQCAGGAVESLARLQRAFVQAAGGRQALGAARVRIEEVQ